MASCMTAGELIDAKLMAMPEPHKKESGAHTRAGRAHMGLRRNSAMTTATRIAAMRKLIMPISGEINSVMNDWEINPISPRPEKIHSAVRKSLDIFTPRPFQKTPRYQR